MDNKVLIALKILIAYLWDEEAAHYRKLEADGLKVGHIFEDLVVIRNWVYGIDETPAEAASKDYYATTHSDHSRERLQADSGEVCE